MVTLPAAVAAIASPALAVASGRLDRRLVLLVMGLAVTLGLVADQYAAYTFITPFLATADHAGPTVVSALLLIFGIGGLVGNFGVVRLLSRRLKATVAGSLLGGGVVGALGDRGAIWTGTVFAALALLGFALFARPAPAGRGTAGPGTRDHRIMSRSLGQRLASGGRGDRRGRAGAGDHVAQLVAPGDAQLGVGPVQVGADRPR